MHCPSPVELPSPLEKALIPSVLPAAYYIPNFITPDEEAQLLHHINAAPLPAWRKLSHRRLQAHPSPLSPSNTLLDAPLPQWLSDPIIPRLLSLRPKACSLGSESLFSSSPHGTPNHCLINEYLPSQGILPHEDGLAYYPVVCTVSLSSHTVLDVVRKPKPTHIRESPRKDAEEGETVGAAATGKKWRILQEQRSLLVTVGECYEECLHGIEGLEVDEHLDEEGVVNWGLLGHQGEFEGGKRRGTRVSLTFRDVVKVKKVGKALGGLLKK